MEESVAKLQLKWQLAEVAQHAISRQGLPVARMAQQKRLQQGLRGFIGEGKELLRSSDKSLVASSMSLPEMVDCCTSLADGVAPSQAEKSVEL